MDGDAIGALGKHPWDAPCPIVLDMTSAIDLGYVPIGSYQETVTAEVEWLIPLVSVSAGYAELPSGLDVSFFDTLFDYSAEDLYW